MSGDVVHAAAGDGVKALLTRWAVAYGGTCEHDEASQLARPTSLRSQCRACTAATPDDWSLTGPCDCCSAYVSDPGRWWVADPDRTAGIGVLMRLCLTCSRRELTDYDDDPEETAMSPCPMCASALTAATLPRDWRWHVECLDAAKKTALTASGADPGLVRRIRVARARETFARVERGAA